MHAQVTRPTAGTVAAAGAVVAYSWFAAGLRPFTGPAYAVTAVSILTVAGLSWRRGILGHRRARPRAAAKGGAAIWAGLYGLLVAWELMAYRASPRADHPTLSSIADGLMGTRGGRTAGFALWLALGAVLFLLPPSPRPVRQERR